MMREEGAALIIALWALAFLSVLMGGVVSTLRLENQQSAYELSHCRASLAAEAGLALAVESLLSPAANPMIADGRTYPVIFDGAKLNLAIRSERGKLDVNFADATTIEHLLRYLGASPGATALIGQQLRQLRATGQMMKAIEQVQQLDGMDAELYAKLEPNITLWTGLGKPDAFFATPDVRSALKLPSGEAASSPGSIVTISSHAQIKNGVSGDLQATVYLTPNGGGRQIYRVLRWR